MERWNDVGDPFSRLCRAIRGRSPLDEIRSIVEEDPRVVRVRGFDTYSNPLPLHDAIGHHNDPEVIEYFLEQWPESIQERTDKYDGDFPIHLACRRGSLPGTPDVLARRFRVLQIIAEARPDLLRERDLYGGLPLHLVDDLDSARYLADKWPQALREVDRDGMLPIHHAAAWRRPSLTRFFAEQWPPSVQKTDKKGRLPLHYACSRVGRLHCPNEPFEPVRHLLAQWPESIQVQDVDGYLPLHHALTELCQPTDGVRPALPFIVDQWRQALRTKSNDGGLPLLVAVRNRLPVDEIRYLVAQYPEAIRERSNDGLLPVHEAARVGSTEGTAEFLVEAWPGSVRERTHEGCTPLHEAARAGNAAAVRYFAEVWPGSVRETTDAGWLPLHMAAQARATDDDTMEKVLEGLTILLRQHPRALWEATNEGYLPLHAAVSRGQKRGDAYLDARQSELCIVEILRGQFPMAARVAARDGSFPVHCALRNALSLYPVEVLVGEWPESLLTRSIGGHSALHMAVMRVDDPLLDLVEFVMEQQPQLLGDADKDGSFPIHAAVAHHQPIRILECLVNQRPEILEYADRNGCLPLHVAVSCETPSLKAIEFLVRARPGTVQRKDGRGRLALHAAALHQAPVDVLYLLIRAWPEAIRTG
jgi:ankyrin repeat protein